MIRHNSESPGNFYDMIRPYTIMNRKSYQRIFFILENVVYSFPSMWNIGRLSNEILS